MVKLAPFFVKAVGPSVVKLAPVALQIAVPAITNVAMPVFTKAAIAKALLLTNSVIVNAAIAKTFGVGTLGAAYVAWRLINDAKEFKYHSLKMRIPNSAKEQPKAKE